MGDSTSDGKGLSWLYMVRGESKFEIVDDFDNENHKDIYHKSANFFSLVLPEDANVIAFSDRPHRYAGRLPGGIEAFADFFLDPESGFIQNPPNIAFTGYHDETGKEYYSVFALQSKKSGQLETSIIDNYSPVFHTGKHVAFDIDKSILPEKFPPVGFYSNVSLIIDSDLRYYLWKSETDEVPFILDGKKRLNACLNFLGQTYEYDGIKWKCEKV